MKEKYGFPLVDSENIFQVLEEKGIRPWEREKSPIPLEDYLKTDLSENQKWEVEKFSPKTEVVFLRQPDGKTFNGFRSVGEDGVIVFTLLENNLVVIVADFVHGGEILRLKSPAGFYKDGMGSPFKVAKREVEEETGIKLADGDLKLLTPEGVHDEPRRLTMKEYYFLANISSPTLLPARPDPTEFLQPVLIPLEEWLKLIRAGKVSDSTAITATMFALFELKRL